MQKATKQFCSLALHGPGGGAYNAPSDTLVGFQRSFGPQGLTDKGKRKERGREGIRRRKRKRSGKEEGRERQIKKGVDHGECVEREPITGVWVRAATGVQEHSHWWGVRWVKPPEAESFLSIFIHKCQKFSI